MDPRQKTEKHTRRSRRGRLNARRRQALELIIKVNLDEADVLKRMAEERDMTLNELILDMVRDFFSNPAPLLPRVRALEAK